MPREQQQLHQMALDRAIADPLVAKMVQYLVDQNRVPKLVTAPTGDSAKFSSGWELPAQGEISYDPQSASSLPHELTHAMQGAVAMQAYKSGKYSLIRDIVAKLTGDYNYRTKRIEPGPAGLAAQLNPAFAARGKDYRATNKELPAWAVGSSAAGFTTSPNHLDSTLQTELSILLDSLTRANKK